MATLHLSKDIVRYSGILNRIPGLCKFIIWKPKLVMIGSEFMINMAIKLLKNLDRSVYVIFSTLFGTLPGSKSTFRQTVRLTPTDSS